MLNKQSHSTMYRLVKGSLYLFFILLNCFSGYSQEEGRKISISDDIELIKLSEHAYIHVSYAELPRYGRVGSNGLIFISRGEAFLFDTPVTDSLTRELVTWLTDSLKIKIVGFVPNHWHIDCMGGIKAIREMQIESYANQMTIDIAKMKDLPTPDHGFNDSLILHAGSEEILCYYPGVAHSTDNIAIWIPSDKILFAGCMIKSLGSTNLGNTADGDLNTYPETIAKLKLRFPEARIIVPGHGDYGGPELINHTLKLAHAM
jgi:metallo-beta-lactamase class B